MRRSDISMIFNDCSRWIFQQAIFDHRRVAMLHVFHLRAQLIKGWDARLGEQRPMAVSAHRPWPWLEMIPWIQFPSFQWRRNEVGMIHPDAGRTKCRWITVALSGWGHCGATFFSAKKNSQCEKPLRSTSQRNWDSYRKMSRAWPCVQTCFLFLVHHPPALLSHWAHLDCRNIKQQIHDHPATLGPAMAMVCSQFLSLFSQGQPRTSMKQRASKYLNIRFEAPNNGIMMVINFI